MGLRTDLNVIFFGFLLDSCALAKGEEEVDEDDDRAEGRAHFMGQILIAVPHRLQLRPDIFVLLG